MTKPTRIYRLAGMMEATGLGRTSIYRKIKSGQIPKPVKILGSRAIGWPEEDVLRVQKTLLAERDEPADPKAA
jgi:prophage regulatory protein